MDRGGQPRQNEIARSQGDVPLNDCTPSAGGGEWKRWDLSHPRPDYAGDENPSSRSETTEQFLRRSKHGEISSQIILEPSQEKDWKGQNGPTQKPRRW